jgi:hypothetical protein
MSKKVFNLDALLQTSDSTEEFEGAENQEIVAPMIRAGLTQADPPETPKLRDRKRFHSPLVVKIVVILAPIDFGPPITAVRAVDRPALQMVLIASLYRVLRWLDPEGLEIKANLLT